MVLVALGHPGDPAHPGVEIARVVAQGVPEGVGLDVGLGDDVEPELVGEVEEDRVVRVVRGPDGVEAEPLHLDEVCPEVAGGQGPAGQLVEVVAIDTADQDAATIDEEVDADDLDPPEPDPERLRLDDPAGRILEGDRYLVERRPLGGPRLRGGDLDRPTDRPVDRQEFGVGVERGPDGRPHREDVSVEVRFPAVPRDIGDGGFSGEDARPARDRRPIGP